MITGSSGYLWREGTFSVPEDIPHERVAFRFDQYVQRYGDALEKQGFTVLFMTEPHVYRGRLPVEPGRRKYVFHAWVKRRPRRVVLDVPDAAVARLLQKGFQLA